MSAGQELLALMLGWGVIGATPVVLTLYWWEERNGRQWWEKRKGRSK